jgi:phosphoglycerate dehydrogenase-like enzyme
MKPVNLTVTTAIGDKNLQQIANVSPSVKITEVSGLFEAEAKGDITNKKKLDAILDETEVAYGIFFPTDLVIRSPKLKWVQVMLAGVNRLLNDTGMFESTVIMTNIRGIHATPVGEFALMLMLMFVKKAPFFIHLQQNREWNLFTPTILHSKTVGIVGLGSIGQEVARLAKAIRMRVIATRRSIKKVTRTRYADIVLPSDQLPELLSQSDFVIITLPLIPETNKIISERELKLMKSDAYLINVSRGGVIDERALIRALNEGWIAGAGLDVFATEPLPSDNQLWECPNIILSSHISGMMEDYHEQCTELFCKNLRRYLNGQNLLNVIDKRKGY